MCWGGSSLGSEKTSCGPDPCACRPARGGELSQHEPLWLPLRCGAIAPVETPSYRCALPPLLLALPRDTKPCAEADHGDQHAVSTVVLSTRGQTHAPTDASHLLGCQSHMQPQSTPGKYEGSAAIKRAMPTSGRKGFSGSSSISFVFPLPCPQPARYPPHGSWDQAATMTSWLIITC